MDRGGTMNRAAILIATLIILALGVFAWYKASSPSNVEIRAAMDIGSGATNLKIAKVDRDTNKIISQIFEQSIPVPYQKHLEQSTNGTFDREVMDQGIKAIQALKETADSYHAKKVVAVATAAFRFAQNAPAFAEEIQKQTGVKVNIISQEQEGVLAFRGAVATQPVNPENVVVWDIGGGSLQLTAVQHPEGNYEVEMGTLASIPFKNILIGTIQGKNPQLVHTPNPVTPEDVKQSIQYIEMNTVKGNPYIMHKIREPQTKVLAVGSLFNYGIKPVAGGNAVITQENLDTGLSKLLNKTDEELQGGSFAEVAVSNPLLILGYMKAWNLPEVTVVNVNNADGALSFPAYWQD